MTTGKIEYAPDYKSEQRRPLNIVFEQGMECQRLVAERARLERKVIETAKAMRSARKVISAEFDAAVDALIEFESQQQEQKEN